MSEELMAIFIEQLVLTRKHIDAALKVLLGEEGLPEVTTCPGCGASEQMWATVDGFSDGTVMCQACHTFFKRKHDEEGEDSSEADQYPSVPTAS